TANINKSTGENALKKAFNRFSLPLARRLSRSGDRFPTIAILEIPPASQFGFVGADRNADGDFPRSLAY
ncbi:MAG TPA: hypothetical protein VE641_19175, partial [Chthoniobacterales bacterium]|nr:hypothetical protein [Chthoniobacterales bacterium]